MRTAKVTLSLFPTGWKWFWVAPNGLLLAQCPRKYARRIDAVRAAEQVIGDEITISFYDRRTKYGQGRTETRGIFVEVLG